VGVTVEGAAQVGDDTVGRGGLGPQCPERVIIKERGGFQATPPVPAGRDPTHGISVSEAWGRDSTRHRLDNRWDRYDP